jgi:lysophospholipase
VVQSIVQDEEVFPGPDGDLYQRRARPETGARAELLVLPGYGDHSGRYLPFLTWMAERGVAMRALDFRGHGRAGGRRGHVDRWNDYLDDLTAFEARTGGAEEGLPRFMLGHSHGGLVLAAAVLAGREKAVGCILSAPFFRNTVPVPRSKRVLARVANPFVPWLPVPTGLKSEWMSSDPHLRAEGHRDPLSVPTATPRWFLGALEAQERMMRHAKRFDLPLLVLVGERDPVADPRAAHEFFDRAAARDKTFRVYPNMLHELLRELEREKVYRHILEWIDARL